MSPDGGQARMTQRMEARARKTWRLQFLSTGEVDPATVAAEGGKRLPAGAEVRLPSVPADAGAGLGCWQELHGHADGQAFAMAIEAGARRHHGHAARAFVERLAAMRAADPAELERAVKASQRAFCAAHVPKGANGQVGRVAKRFALVAAAGASWRSPSASSLGRRARPSARPRSACGRGCSSAAAPARRRPPNTRAGCATSSAGTVRRGSRTWATTTLGSTTWRATNPRRTVGL
jgi:hypothetical protein